MLTPSFVILLVGLLVCSRQVLQTSAKKECGLFDLLVFEEGDDYYRRGGSNSTIEQEKETTGRIIGGRARKNTLWFPSIAHVMFKSEDGFEHECGGTLIDEWHVLTSASCVEHSEGHTTSGEAGTLPSWVVVTLGMVDRNELNEHTVNLPTARHSVWKVVVHANYNEATLENDIAVLKLNVEVTMSRWIQPACLPDAQSNSYPRKQEAVAVGWGKTRPNNKNAPLSRFLRFVGIDIDLTGKRCRKTGGNAILRPKDLDAQICAGGKGRRRGDTCDGDQGGPIYVTETGYLNYDDDRLVLAGITSYNRAETKCGNKKILSIYTRVSHYLDWINQVVETGEGGHVTVTPGGGDGDGVVTAGPITSCSVEGMVGPSCETECGISFASPNVKIVGGIAARESSWPASVMLLVCKRGTSSCWQCGGTLIDRRTVLTAAHCLEDDLEKYEYKVYAGFEKYADLEKSSTVQRAAKRVLIHQDYDEDSFDNDIGLLHLDTPVELTERVQVACLAPGPRSSSTYPTDGQSSWVVGWGTLRSGGNLADDLQNVKINVYDGETECAAYGPTDWSLKVCAGEYEGGKDSCQGDSGGALYVFDSSNFNHLNSGSTTGKYVVAGVVSYGQGCAARRYPGIYTRVSAYLDWIQEARAFS
jgi:secreted trypsin-like serine protease